MQLLEGELVLSASDLTGFAACEHLTQLELSVVRGERERATREDPMLDVLSRRGTEHEVNHLARLKARGLTVVEITGDYRTRAELHDAQAADRRRDAAGRRRDLPGHLLRRAARQAHLARPRRLPLPGRHAERSRRLVLRGRRHQARPPGEGRGHPPDVRLLGAARRAPGRHARAGARRHRRRRGAPLPPRRLLRLLPPPQGPLRGARRRGRRRQPRRHLSRAGRPLRHLPLGRRVQEPSPRRRSPLPRVGPAPRPGAQARRGRRHHPRRAGQGARRPARPRHGRADRRPAAAPGAPAGGGRRRAPADLRGPPAGAARPRRSARPLAATRVGRAARAVTRRPLLRHGGRPVRARRRCGHRPRVPLRRHRARPTQRQAELPQLLGAQPRRGEDRVRGLHRLRDGAARASSRPARVPLRALRALGDEAPHGQPPHA